MTRGAIAWAGAAALLGLFALLGWPLSRESLDWQPQLAFTQPRRALTAVAVHYSPMHLTGNLAGLIGSGLVRDIVFPESKSYQPP